MKNALAIGVVVLVLLGLLAWVRPQATGAAQATGVTTAATTMQAGQIAGSDLSQLPLPLYGSAVDLHPAVPVVFLLPPAPRAMRATGIITILTRKEMQLAESPWLIVLLVVIFCFLMAKLLWAMVRRQARARLQVSN